MSTTHNAFPKHKAQITPKQPNQLFQTSLGMQMNYDPVKQRISTAKDNFQFSQQYKTSLLNISQKKTPSTESHFAFGNSNLESLQSTNNSEFNWKQGEIDPEKIIPLHNQNNIIFGYDSVKYETNTQNTFTIQKIPIPTKFNPNFSQHHFSFGSDGSTLASTKQESFQSPPKTYLNVDKSKNTHILQQSNISLNHHIAASETFVTTSSQTYNIPKADSKR